MKRPFAILATAAAATMFGFGQAHAQTLQFTGTRENVSPLLPPGSGHCAPAFFNTVNIPPGALLSTGTSNISSFFSTQSHCVSSTPPTPLSDGQFTYTFEKGDTIFGTYTGEAVAGSTPGVFNATENLVVTGGTGRFVEATGTITSARQLQIVSGNGTFQGTLTGSLLAPTTTVSGEFATGGPSPQVG